MNKQSFITKSQAETEALGARLAKTLKAGDVVAFYGELGAGKTAFTRGALCEMGFGGHITSPTFTIVNEYRNERFFVAHFDMYRIETEDALYSTGFYDYLDGKRILFIEWTENIEYALDFPHITVTITAAGETERKIEIEGGEAL